MPGPLQALTLAKTIAKPKQHVLLLSHMRAYTSLFGHIMGSNPEICGYYELHIGYHSWKSLIRQQLVYFQSDTVKPDCRYMFDKVLHNDHNVAQQVLAMPRVRAIFSLRHPTEVIPSILKLYSKVDPEHEFNSSDFCIQYYTERLGTLELMVQNMTQPYFYMDADSLKQDTAQCLEKLTDWLSLKKPLTENYELQTKTSEARSGDNSERLRSGKINREKSDYSSTPIDRSSMQPAIDAFERVRPSLIKQAAVTCLIEPHTTG